MEMDAITAHFDRGWDLLDRGDLGGARLSADHILLHDSESPEGHALLGAIAAAEGDHDEALDRFGRALEADPDYLDAMLYAADVAVHMAGDHAYALQLCAEAEDAIGGTGAEMLEIGLLRAEAHLISGGFEEARRAVAVLPAAPYPDEAFYLRAGRLMLEVERIKPAIETLAEVLDHQPSRVEAHHLTGIALEMEGRPEEAQKHLLTAEQLNRQQPPPPWALAPAEFENLVRQVVDQMPDPLGRYLRASLLHVLDYPSLEMVVEGLDPRTPGYLAGTPVETGEPPSRRRPQGRRKSAAQLKGIFIYRRNIENVAASRDVVAAEIHRALAQEGAFFFGLDDDEYATLLDAIP